MHSYHCSNNLICRFLPTLPTFLCANRSYCNTNVAEDRDEVHESLVLIQLETSWAEGLITSKETLEDTMVKRR